MAGHDRATRRQFLTGVLGGTVVSVPFAQFLTSCGGEDSSGNTAGSIGASSEPLSADTTAGAVASATSAPSAAGPTGTIRIATTFASNVEPILLSDSTGIAVVQPTAAYLMRSNNALELEPWIATEWASPDDGTTWDFALRTDVMFHDGTAVTADDVVATFQRLVDKEIGSPLSFTLDFLQASGIEATDASHVRFTLDRPVAQFPYFTIAYQAMVLPAAYEVGTFIDNPIGCGPFRLVSYEARGDARYEAFADYFVEGEPKFAEITLVGFESEDAILPALISGDVDATVISAPSQNNVLAAEEGVSALYVLDARHLAIHLKTTAEPWSNALVRRALATTIDRQAYLDGVLGGQGEVGQDHVVAPIVPDFVQLTEVREADAEAAKALLSDAGVDGVQDTIYFPAELPDHRDMAVYVQDQAKSAGFELEVEGVPLAEYFDKITGYNIAVVGWGHRNTPGEFFRSGYTSDAPFNYGAWSNADFDSRVEELDSTLDSSERSVLTEEIEQIMFTEVPAIIPVWPGQSRVVRNDIVGFEPTPALLMPVAEASRA